MERWINFSNYVAESSDRAKIAWRRYPDEILQGEVEVLLRMHGIYASHNTIVAAAAILKMYSKHTDVFYISDSSSRQYDAGIGKLLFNRIRDRSSREEEARKTMKVWMSSSLEDFLSSLEKLVRFNAKAHHIVPLNDLLSFCSRWENDPERNVRNISSGYFSAIPKEDKTSE